MAQILMLGGIALVAVILTTWFRKTRDVTDLKARVAQRGGTVVRLARTRKGHPFASTGRGWWAWRVVWRGAAGEQTSWALTTREGIAEWRD